MIKKVSKNEVRVRRHKRVRNKVSGTPTCPRLCVFRSNANIHAQIIDDTTGTTLVAVSSVSLKLENGGNIEAAKTVGAKLAEAAKAKEKAAEAKVKGDELRDIVAGLLTDEVQTIDAILAQVDFADVTKAKVTARLTQLCKAHIAEKETVKVENRTLTAYKLA